MMALEAPVAFDPPEFVRFGGETALYYYSFVTLTTLGFGDITPISDLAQILTTLEAILGLVVIAVLVGREVGLLVNQESAGSNQNAVPVAPGVESEEVES
jgi:mannose/fructose/N-acetylgalactosamine-specific phosphotransferase system component IID